MSAGAKHVLGVVSVAITVAVCYYVWTIVPMLIGQSVFEDFRIVAGALALALTLTAADGVVTKVEEFWHASASHAYESKQASEDHDS